ncbi:hypothetical protein F7R91_33450 [Streptomyces luteolifulvus]|uniref:Uncharacterized protein n=1 Tax=Streptomyces luteolifulvus TaxID=2615112 RepID=A0A6H9USU0_9ACTN|nr:hypothetical protein [Streptomyces luteolifulvus]KAB1141122.1 hypothetical protein F7R91_33450 [Streptomyces luteolifulvus]
MAFDSDWSVKMSDPDDGDDETRPGHTFHEQVVSLGVSRGGGTREVESGEIIKLVRADPEAAAATCLAYVDMAKKRTENWQWFAQLAVVLAGAYEVDFNDDTLSVWVGSELENARVTIRLPEFEVRSIDGGSVESTQSLAPSVNYRVSTDLLTDSDIYPFVIGFSHHGHPYAAERGLDLRAMRGRLIISFDVPPSDPREVWEIPEIRKYVGKLADHLPYLPYYFDPRPGFGMILVWLYCLAPPQAISDRRLTPTDIRVVTQVASTMLQICSLAEFLDDDPQQVISAVFSALPNDYTLPIADMVLATYRSSDDGH